MSYSVVLQKLTQHCKSTMCACMLSLFSRVQLLATPWTVMHQAPMSMRLSRQEYWSGLSYPSPGGLSNPRIEPVSPCGSCIAGRFFTREAPNQLCVGARWLQLCLTLCNPVDHSPPNSSVHGFPQARILDRVAISSSRGSSQPRDRICVS